MSNRRIFATAVTAVVLLFGIIMLRAIYGHNDSENWQIIQDLDGAQTIRDEAGIYYTGFSTVTTYPRVFSIEWGPDVVTFNDGGTATMSGIARIRTPSTEPERFKLHKEFSADGSMRNAETAIEQHIVNVLQVTGPVMSGSEHQSARKGEFYNLAFEQLENGLYQSERIQVDLPDQLDQNGKAIRVFATKVVRDPADGKPIIEERSPLIQYGFEIAQFSISKIVYDDKTLDLFAAKKESFLNAEKSKAAREEQAQEKLMIIERGLKEKTEVEAQANKEKAKLTIEAETKVAVAEQQAKEAVARQAMEQTQAETRRNVAAMNLEAERLNSEATKVAAAAQEEKIRKAGAITEHDRVLAEIAARARVGVAEQLAKIAVPSFMITGGSEGGSSLEQLLNVFMLRQMGVFDPSTVTK